MADTSDTVTRAAAPVVSHEGSYADWSAILAGAVVASAIGFVFATFGGALGLSLISPYEGEGSAIAALLAVGTWMLWTTISSFMAGGYIAGRLRRRVDAATADEVGVRDGIHGLAVWGVAVLVGAYLLSASADTAVMATSETATAVATAADSAGEETTEAAAQATGAADVTEAEAKAAAEAARQYSVLTAFALSAALMIAAAAAYWAASVGGHHRDEGRTFANFGRWT